VVEVPKDVPVFQERVSVVDRPHPQSPSPRHQPLAHRSRICAFAEMFSPLLFQRRRGKDVLLNRKANTRKLMLFAHKVRAFGWNQNCSAIQIFIFLRAALFYPFNTSLRILLLACNRASVCACLSLCAFIIIRCRYR